jgi:hypothetical protein
MCSNLSFAFAAAGWFLLAFNIICAGLIFGFVRWSARDRPDESGSDLDAMTVEQRNRLLDGN